MTWASSKIDRDLFRPMRFSVDSVKFISHRINPILSACSEETDATSTTFAQLSPGGGSEKASDDTEDVIHMVSERIARFNEIDATYDGLLLADSDEILNVKFLFLRRSSEASKSSIKPD